MHITISTAGRHHRALPRQGEGARREPVLFHQLRSGPGPSLRGRGPPAEAAPADTDELGIASVFHEAPLRARRGTHPAPFTIVANAMYALECEIVPGEVADEGPFCRGDRLLRQGGPAPGGPRARNPPPPRTRFSRTILSGVEVWNSVGLPRRSQRALPARAAGAGRRGRVLQPRGAAASTTQSCRSRRSARAGPSRAILAAFAAFPPLKMVTVVRHRRRHSQSERRRSGR